MLTFTALLLLLMVSACGGGGGSSTLPATNPTVKIQATENTTPTIRGTFDSARAAGGFTVTVNGVTYTHGSDPQLSATDDDWSLTIPAGSELAPGAYNVEAKAMDDGANVVVDASTDELLIVERVSFSGSGNLGMFDPSVSRDPGTNRLWMSYSSVDQSPYYDPALYWAVSLRLAYSGDNGVSWQDAGVVVPAYTEAVVGPMEAIPAATYGIWQSETSSLVYDPSAPANERWKLIWHQYLHAGPPGKENSHFNRHGWLALKMAATPADLAGAPLIKLFGGIGLSTDGENTAAPAHSPIGGPPAIQLNLAQLLGVNGANLDELLWCAFTEPGLIATNTFLYLTTTCADAVNYDPIDNPVVEEYIIHFRCASPCNMSSAASWEYMGRLLTPADAVTATGYHHFQAPALVEKGGKHYLMVTPVESPSSTPYSGCRVYEFSDINSNQLLRSAGNPVEVKRIDGNADMHNGACAAYSGLDGGLLWCQFEPANTPETFRVYKSQVLLP